ncbi:P-loop containing nucleoside triphosphate hydrolase domain-containing protein [Strongyloides ratti]|uniref:P-loop containing Nucleoside triphosphate hydrolase domain-containing protein n=1 Tax=Strongyloides ratti TaxID=34506 RepID=A0A090LHV1_STRRB|nr:P-loop containing nucleoside triphosphate hydrolase domain-containing protein [Strongyloides ratti]CEF69322.1 P-loop containing nucleoside triphosphate hydrolase domain-containing protein [Strongyloides ratti]
MCIPPRRITMKEYQPFCEDKYNINPFHYNDFQMNYEIIKNIYKFRKTYIPSADTYKIYYSLNEENKHDIRITGIHDFEMFISYFPLILDTVTKSSFSGVKSMRPKIVFLCNTSDDAINIYTMITNFANGLNIKVALSNHTQKMKTNFDNMKLPFMILVTTVKNFEYHLSKNVLYLTDCSYFVMINLSTWKKDFAYPVLVALMISSGWSPKNQCSVIATSEEFSYTSQDIFNYFSYKNYYDINI